MKEFKFVMNEYKNVCYVFVDVNEPPIDTIYLTQYLSRNKLKDFGEVKNGWEPQCFKVKEMFGFRTASIERIKGFYNSRYDEICEAVYPKDLLKLPDVVSGYYVDHDRIKVSRAETRVEEYRFGVANTLEQAKGMAAFCALSQILPIFNEGWEPDWLTTEDTIKQCIRTFENGAIQVYGTFDFRSFLAFETEEKAMLFLKEKIDLITDLSNARII